MSTKVHIQSDTLTIRHEGLLQKKCNNILANIGLTRIHIAHPRVLRCVIIVRISQTHKYNDLQLSKLLATNEINRVPSEFEIIWDRRGWAMIHLSCCLRNSNRGI